ncbi:hypothetical protein [Nocardia bhagyanarayanae]|nr:hypothetical protein [Nocardia bhagyanarayanae]
MAELDLEPTAISLLAAGERAAQLVVSEPGRFTADRYRNFAAAPLGP